VRARQSPELHDRERDSLEFKIATYRNDLGVGLTLMRRVGTVLRVSAFAVIRGRSRRPGR
jgi:hypothetical protein